MKAEVGKSKAYFYLHHLLLISPLPNFMTSNFRVLTSNIFFTSDSVWDKTFTIRWGGRVHSERERERGGWGGVGGGGREREVEGAEVDFFVR